VSIGEEMWISASNED